MHGEPERSIVLTGATGFLGAYLMAGLLERGYRVTVLGRPRMDKGLSERLSDLVEWLGIDPKNRLSSIEVDLSKSRLGLNDGEYGHLCARAGKIVHCASDTSFAERNRERVVETNVNGLSTLIDFAIDSEAEHMYYVSTAYACGLCEGACMEAPIAGEHFTNVYEETKALAEEILARRCDAAGMPYSILRPSIVYGHSKTGSALKFNALYYAVKSLSFVRDIFRKDVEQGEGRSAKWGVHLDDDGILRLPLEIHLPGEGSVNLIPVDHFVEVALRVIESDERNGIYHVTCDDPPRITTLMEYAERFLGVRGIRAHWNPSGKNLNPNPAEELFERFIKPNRPYLSDKRTFDRNRVKGIAGDLSTPPFSYDIFERCMAYAAACDWGKASGFPQ
jgi:nucleoside-diphosphate-sugar epimerase